MDTMMSTMEEMLKPVEMKAGYENIRKIRNEGIVIICTSKEEIQKLDTEIKAKMGDEYVLKIPKLKNPKLRVYEIEEEKLQPPIAVFIAPPVKQETSCTHEEEDPLASCCDGASVATIKQEITEYYRGIH
ncbi:Retrotransposable element [Gryllus bimaculatus]|nr:Retrotransposable element [Gryllus bimaculatus]